MVGLHHALEQQLIINFNPTSPLNHLPESQRKEIEKYKINHDSTSISNFTIDKLLRIPPLLAPYQHSSLPPMLRRPPTAIKLTSEDLAQYEDAEKERNRAAAIASGLVTQQQLDQQEMNPHDQLKQEAAGGKKSARSREDRIGIGGAAAGR